MTRKHVMVCSTVHCRLLLGHWVCFHYYPLFIHRVKFYPRLWPLKHTHLNMGGCLHGYKSEVLLKQDWEHWEPTLSSVGHPCWNFTNTNLRGNVFYLRHTVKEWKEINNLVSCWPSCVIPNPTVSTEWDLKGWWVCHILLKYVQSEGEKSVQLIVPIQWHQISISC